MYRRMIALLLAGLLALGGVPALAEADAVEIEADAAEIEAGFDLSDEDILPEAPDLALDLDGGEDGLAANETDGAPIELSISKSTTRSVTLGLSYQIVVPGKAIKSCKSSNKKVATVTNAGLVKAKKAGTAKITITPKKGSKLTLKLKVVDPDTPTAVAIAQGNSAQLAVGETLQLTAVVSPDTASQAVSWKSSDKKVASVDKYGLVTALKKGKATITATTGNKLSAKLTLTVKKSGWKSCTIAHAMGGIDGEAYTNSMEAFKENYARGHRLFEVDLHFTSDGKLVLWHSWDFQYCSSHTPGYKPSYKEFMNSKIYDRYTPMDLKKLLKLMAKYPDIRIVLDGKYGKIDTVKREFKLILSTARSLKLTKVLDRMIVELYNKEMYSAVNKIHAFPEYMMALYKLFTGEPSEPDFRSVAEYCRDKHIPVIVMDAEWWNPAFVGIAAECGVKLALYTVNSESQARDYFDAGVIALFTDALPPV